MEKVVAIWAPLRYANYGDDLQAIVFAKYIQSIGYAVKVFQMEKTIAEKYSFDVANTVDELCHDVKICIIAGGALLTPFLLHKRILNKSAAEYENDFKDLNGAIKKYNTKFCAISMGGDGMLRNPFLYYSRHRIKFFRSQNFLDGTVRLQGDVDQMKKFKKNFKYIPDCLLQSPKFLELNKESSLPPERPIRIGLNFKKGKYLDKKLIDDIYIYAENNDDIEFYFAKTHMECTGINYEYTPVSYTKNIKTVFYETPTQLLEFMTGIDMLVTSKLHLGITGLTIGTPYLSYRGPGKAKSFTRSIGGDWAVVDDNVSFETLKDQYFHEKKSDLFNKFDLKSLNEMINESFEQYQFCKEIIEKHA
jgi:hypothetical protein